MTNTVTVTEQNNTVSILEDAPIVTPDPWYQNLKTIPTSSGSATVTADSTPHTKGAFTEIIASNAAETTALQVSVSGINVSATNTSTLLDIATGASGSETVVVSNIAVGGASGVHFAVPLRIAAGARISVRSQAVIASDTASVNLATHAMGDVSTVPTTLDVLGTDPSDSTGTLLSNSIGTYTEIVASTSQEYEALILVPSLSGTHSTPHSFVDYTMAGAVGAAGSEVDVCQQTYRAGLTEYIQAPSIALGQPWAITQTTVAAGSRLSVTQAAATPGPGTGPRVAVIGVPST